MRTAVFLLIIFFASQCSGQDTFTFKDYENVKNDDIFKTYIKGVGAGFLWANAVLELQGRSPLYCQPGRMGLRIDNCLDIIQETINKGKVKLTPDTPLEVILLRGLQETFLCE